MNGWQFISVATLGLLCLILSCVLIIFGRANQQLQTDLQLQQIEINKGNMSQQVGTNLVRDIALSATKNESLKNLLTRNGFTLTENASPSASPHP